MSCNEMPTFCISYRNKDHYLVGKCDVLSDGTMDHVFHPQIKVIFKPRAKMEMYYFPTGQKQTTSV